jgi:hypothetical protein
MLGSWFWGPKMKLLTEYLEHAISFEHLAAQETIQRSEHNSKTRLPLIENSPLDWPQSTDFHHRALPNIRPRSKGASVGSLFHSRTSYSKATPAGSFCSNHFSAGVRGGKYFKMVGISDMLARVDIGPNGRRMIGHRSSRRPL